MKKIYLTLIIGIFLLGITTAGVLTLSNEDFKTKITTMSSDLFYNKLLSMDKIDSKDIPTNKEISLDNTNIEITQNEEGVYRVRTIT